eukprot:TRINITY_DN6463_c0_g1_i1.p1 TRINITY_DN6463_c0_g1~~TRINITY_DN6463_c0_g1_i1.p1  ORF type:complete len:258 (-),score=33.37 TRINITY_DN6463_c0_g1_i1:258-1004(-)
MLPPFQAVTAVEPLPSIVALKPRLYLLSAGYAILLLLCFYAGSENLLNYAFVFSAAFLMASRPNQCMGRCIVPFFMLAFMSLVFDLITVVSLLSREYPRAGYIFSTTCPTNITAVLRKNTTIHLRNARVPGDAAYVVPARTQVSLPEDVCDTAWVVSNVAILLGAFMDLGATVLGSKMVSGMSDGQFGMMQPQNDARGFVGQGIRDTGGLIGTGLLGTGGQLVSGLGQGLQQGPTFQPWQGRGQRLGD